MCSPVSQVKKAIRKGNREAERNGTLNSRHHMDWLEAMVLQLRSLSAEHWYEDYLEHETLPLVPQEVF